MAAKSTMSEENISNLNAIQLSQWFKNLHSTTRERGRSEISNSKTQTICNEIARFVYHHQIHGVQLGNEATFREQDFQDMMNIIGYHGDLLWIWKCIIRARPRNKRYHGSGHEKPSVSHPKMELDIPEQKGIGTAPIFPHLKLFLFASLFEHRSSIINGL